MIDLYIYKHAISPQHSVSKVSVVDGDVSALGNQVHGQADVLVLGGGGVKLDSL